MAKLDIPSYKYLSKCTYIPPLLRSQQFTSLKDQSRAIHQEKKALSCIIGNPKSLNVAWRIIMTEYAVYSRLEWGTVRLLRKPKGAQISANIRVVNFILLSSIVYVYLSCMPAKSQSSPLTGYQFRYVSKDRDSHSKLSLFAGTYFPMW